MTKDEALKLALEALEIQLENSNGEQKYADAISEIKALAQQVQEPYDQTALELCEVCGSDDGYEMMAAYAAALEATKAAVAKAEGEMK